MRPATRAAIVVGLLLPAATPAQPLKGDKPFRMTLLRAAPGRLLDLVAALRRGGHTAAAGALLLRHSQGDHWDLLLLRPVDASAPALPAAPLAPEELVAWQEDEWVRGPDLAALASFREAVLVHAEMFHALAGRRAELVEEREKENAYLRGSGRPQNAIFVREAGASWDCFTLGPYTGWKHYAEREDIPREKSAAAAEAAGFASEEQIGPYLRSLILDHHDSLLSVVR